MTLFKPRTPAAPISGGAEPGAVLRRRHVGFVFQFFNLISNMTVADNVELPALLAGSLNG